MSSQSQNRFEWLDTMKGLSILWIVLFHFCGMSAVVQHYPWVLHPRYAEKIQAAIASLAPAETFLYLAQGLFVAVVQLGFHCVGIFIIASGFGLSYSLAKTGGPTEGWMSWYGKRFIRLYPMYWVAHLIFLFSPFIMRAEPIDYRFLLSFSGIRVHPIDMIFYYANPAWWFFTLLIQLYAAFPLLYFLLKKLRPTNFLILCAVITFGTRYLLLCVVPVNGNFVQGAFFVARLMEFAGGMVLGQLARQNAQLVEDYLFRRSTLVAGIVLYALGLASYFNLWSYTFTDALTGIGLFIILAHLCRAIHASAAPVATSLAFVGTYSYGLYLIHQPYVLYFGERMHNLALIKFVPLACMIIAALFLGSLLVEKYVNQLTNWILKAMKRPDRTTVTA
jgi:peptidoglycan/LPS O-acetylase OafA/YrhL